MARRFQPGRMISRSLYTSGDLVDQPAWVRLLWSGLIVFANEDGMIRDNIRFFSGTILAGLGIRPHRIRNALDTLTERRCISREILDDVSWLRITNFHHGQRLKWREREREIDGKGKGEGSARDRSAPGGRTQGGRAQAPPTPEVGETDPAPTEAFRVAAEFLNLELCADGQEAVVALNRLHLDDAGLREFVRSFREALERIRSKGQMADPRAYVRSRALRFKTATEADLDKAHLTPAERKSEARRLEIEELARESWEQARQDQKKPGKGGKNVG